MVYGDNGSSLYLGKEVKKMTGEVTGFVSIFTNAMQQLAVQMATFLPKIVVAILIWFIGKYFINLAVNLVRKIDIKTLKLDNQAINFLIRIISPLGKFVLVLIILDYFGIGRTVTGAFMSGLTLAIALTLGIAFGRALEKDADKLVDQVRGHLKE